MRRSTDTAGKEENIFRKIREYLGLSIEEIARKVGVATYTWFRWESGLIEIPSQSNLNKIIKLVRKKAHDDFKKEFLKFVVYNKNVQFFGEKEEDIVEEIEKNLEKFIDSPIFEKIFEEHPEFKKLSFREIFEKYTKGKITYDGIVLLNSLPVSPREKRKYGKGNKNIVKQNKEIVKNTRIVNNKSREKKKNSNRKKIKKEGDGEDGCDNSPDDEIKKNFEARYNLIGFFDVLWKIDKKANPEKYIKKE